MVLPAERETGHLPVFFWQVKMSDTRNFFLALTAALLVGWAGPSAQVAPAAGMQAPEGASGYMQKPGWTAQNFMVSAANPLAVDAGYQMLRAGGTAIDAAIAVQMVLTLVEPQSSGIGGGAFLLHFDGKTVKAFDGRETAPAAVTADLFQGAHGQPLSFYDALVGGRSVGVPGVLRMLERVHKEYGRLPWSSLFAPAIRLADQGFAVSPRLATLVATDAHLKKDAVAAAYFYDREGKPWPAGHVLKNPELANVLRDIAAGGADRFYNGDIARDIEAKVEGHAINPGQLTAADIAAYEAKEREPVCTAYRAWTVCGMPPPSSGGIAVAQLLGILAHKNMPTYRPDHDVPPVEAIHLFAEAGRLVYADRNRYVADTDFVPLPGNSVQPLLDNAYLAGRAALVTEKSMGQAQPGVPAMALTSLGIDSSPERPSTSQISIVDAAGNAVSMTASIEDAFGSRQMVRGFLLNNQLTDFSFNPADANGLVANRVQPGKRPRSAMAPTLVFETDTKKLVLVIGSPGGSAIINYVGKVLIATLDWGLSVQQAISLPNFGSRNGPTEIEQGRLPDSIADQLRAKGHDLRLMEQTSGLQGIMRGMVDGRQAWIGGADPRREGVAKGD